MNENIFFKISSFFPLDLLQKKSYLFFSNTPVIELIEPINKKK